VEYVKGSSYWQIDHNKN